MFPLFQSKSVFKYIDEPNTMFKQCKMQIILTLNTQPQNTHITAYIKKKELSHYSGVLVMDTIPCCLEDCLALFYAKYFYSENNGRFAMGFVNYMPVSRSGVGKKFQIRSGYGEKILTRFKKLLLKWGLHFDIFCNQGIKFLVSHVVSPCGRKY